MSCRSQSDAYKAALTDRFTDITDAKPFDIHNAELFAHKPLEDPSTELRYLYLLPRTHNIHLNGQTVVHCELLSDAELQTPSYVGLSYTWGDPQIRRPILVGDKVFHATENLAIALKHLQEDDKTIIFWIDAICIDQTNLHEKSIQVQRMGNIFASAVMVIAWIGPAADDSDLALQELEIYGKDNSIPLSISQLRKSHGERIAALPVGAIKALFARPWFKRVWVGQEVALNKTVIFVCGHRDIDRTDLLECYFRYLQTVLVWKGDRFPMDFLRLNHVDPLSLSQFLNHDFIDAYLSCGSELESSDPRDFVYSSFGRISNIEECGLRVDYTKTVEEIYTDFAEAIVRAGYVWWFSEVWSPSSTYKDLPSWVPDWSETDPCDYLSSSHLLEYNIAEVCNIERGGKALRISAQRITRISRVEKDMRFRHDVLVSNLSTPALVTPPEEEDGYMCSLDTIQQALGHKERWSTEEVDKAVFDLSTGMSMTRFWMEDLEEQEVAGELYTSYQAFRGRITPPDDIPDPQAWRKDASHAYLNILRDSNIKDFFMTPADVVGVSRDSVEPNDWLCALGGMEGVWVLREVGEGYYRIVSLANVFPWDNLKDSDAPVEVLTIV
jgi:hypothetical protein